MSGCEGGETKVEVGFGGVKSVAFGATVFDFGSDGFDTSFKVLRVVNASWEEALVGSDVGNC